VGKYYIDEHLTSDDMPLLHPFLYASKSTYEGSKGRYVEEECRLPISKIEFEKYLFSYPNRKVTVFSDYRLSGGGLRLEAITLILQGNFRRYSVESISAENFAGRYEISVQRAPVEMRLRIPDIRGSRYVYPGESMSVHQIFSILTAGTPQGTRGITLSPSSKISFDVLTIYEILTNRGSCINIIKRYARNMTLNIFNDYVLRFNKIETIHMLNLYLASNASVLGLDESFLL
jgi:hypothetical protein